MDNHIDLLYSHTGYDVINYFRSDVIAKKTIENAAFDGFGWNFLRTDEAKCLPATIDLTNPPDMTSLAASSRLQNAVKYYTKVHKTGAQAKESNSSATI